MENVTEEVLLFHNFFHAKLLKHLKIQTVIKSHSLMRGASNSNGYFAIFDVLFFFISGIILAHNGF